MISNLMDRVMERADEWQNRLLKKFHTFPTIAKPLNMVAVAPRLPISVHILLAVLGFLKVCMDRKKEEEYV